MARKTLLYTVTDDNRDRGKTFLITEMSAARAESWAMRALLALMEGGVEIPEGIERMGLAGIAKVGLQALSRLSWEKAKPLIDEMLDCVQIVPDPSKPHVVRPLIESDIEEITTLAKLRIEVWKLHTDFLTAAAPSTSQESGAAARPRKGRNAPI